MRNLKKYDSEAVIIEINPVPLSLCDVLWMLLILMVLVWSMRELIWIVGPPMAESDNVGISDGEGCGITTRLKKHNVMRRDVPV
jgi:hypothetical protein